MESTVKDEGKKSLSSSAGTLAAGLIWADRAQVSLWILLIAAPALFEEVMNRFDPLTAFSLSVAERAFELLFLSVISARWVKRLKTAEWSPSASNVLQLFAFGFILWALIIFPPALAGL